MSKNASFKKSTYSDHGGACVEVARVQLVAVRDSTDPGGPVLWFNDDEWNAFLAGARAGEFDFS